MEAAAVDAMRDDVDSGKGALAPLRAQAVEGVFKLPAGKIGVDDHPIGLLERGCIVLVADPAVERDVAGDLQTIAKRAERAQIMVEVPDILQNEDERRVDLLDHAAGLKGGKDIAAMRIGRVNGQAAIADRLAGIADAEIVDFVTVGEPPHDAVHHPR